MNSGLHTKAMFVPIHQEEHLIVHNKVLCKVVYANGLESEETIPSWKSGQYLGAGGDAVFEVGIG